MGKDEAARSKLRTPVADTTPKETLDAFLVAKAELIEAHGTSGPAAP